MQEFITTQGCRRVVLDRKMDGQEDRVGCEEGEEWCDRCRRDSVGLDGGQRQTRQQRKAQQRQGK